MSHYYQTKKAALATQHKKERVIAPAFSALGLSLYTSAKLDTDTLGTFSGEIKRKEDMLATATKKAELGMIELGLPLGIASEGSFGPHPKNPFLPSDMEVMVFKDGDLGITICESLISCDTNYNHLELNTFDSDAIDIFLEKAKFPSHGIIVRAKGSHAEDQLYKGIQEKKALNEIILKCLESGKVMLETDMRAHMNPLRMQTIEVLAKRLVTRIQSLCPSCGLPGFGRTTIEFGLPCELCDAPTHEMHYEIYSCIACDYKIKKLREDGRLYGSPAYCDFCNP